MIAVIVELTLRQTRQTLSTCLMQQHADMDVACGCSMSMHWKGRLRKFFICSVTAPRKIRFVSFPFFISLQFFPPINFVKAARSLHSPSLLFLALYSVNFKVQVESRIRYVFRVRLQQAHDTKNTLTFWFDEDRRSRCFVRGTVDTAVGAE
jgi:hypothetical protein